MLRVHQFLQQKGVVTIRNMVDALNLSEPTIGYVIKDMEKLEIVRELTGRERYRVFAYDRYMKLLDEGTQPLPTA